MPIPVSTLNNTNSWIDWIVILFEILYIFFIIIKPETNKDKEKYYIAMIYLDSYVVPTMYEIGSSPKLYQEAVTLSLKHFEGNVYNYSYGCPKMVNKLYLSLNHEIILEFRTGKRSNGKIKLDSDEIKSLENNELFLLVNIDGKILKEELKLK